jgi:hypothetical protein
LALKTRRGLKHLVLTTSSKGNAMPEKLSEVGRRHAALAAGAEVAGVLKANTLVFWNIEKN